MSKRPAHFRSILCAVALTALALDLGSKAAAVRWLDEPIDLRILTLRVVRNPGIAFGLGSSAPSWLVLAIVSAVATFVLVASFRGALGGAVPAGLVAGGAVANVVDRTHGGTVVDIFDLGWWPTFNLADAFIVIGAALMLIGSMRTTSQPIPGNQATEARKEGRA